MTAKKSYNRYFIIFQEEDKGYGIAIDKQPTGYTKIETRSGRCKVTVYAQNLVKDRGPYLCCLIDATKNPVAIAKLGEITVDETGRGETWWEYREDDVAETGIPVDRFNVAAVIVEGDELGAPLTGYIGRDKITWKDRIKAKTEESKENFKETKAEDEILELDEDARKFKEYEEMIKGQASQSEEENSEASEDIKEEEHRQQEEQDTNKEDRGTPKENKDTTVEDRDIPEENKDALGETTDEESVNTSNDQEEEAEVQRVEDDNADIETFKGFEEEDNDDEYEDIIADVVNIDNQFDDIDYRVDAENYDGDIESEFLRDGRKKRRRHAYMFHEVLKHFKETYDLVDGMKKVRWWKIPHSHDIPIKENSLYPYFCSIYHLKMTYPYINYIKYYKKPGYYYFGIKYDSNGEVKYIMYGIEGKNSTLEQPYMGMTGFTKWHGAKCNDREKGIWVMYYNPYTGCIMIPKDR